MRHPSGQWSVVSGRLRQSGRALLLTTGHWPLATAFTLVELMISLAMMIVLMYAVNFIFSSVGKATGAAQTISAINRNVQAAQATMVGDFSGLVDSPSECPFFIIQSDRIAAFRDHKDEIGSPNPANPLQDVDASGNVITYGAPSVNYRSHRIDFTKFFSRGTFVRQTGNDGVYMADMASGEAMICYGHLSLYNNAVTAAGVPILNVTGSFPTPASGTSATNPNNFYSTQWILGRNVILMVKPDATGAIKDKGGNPQYFYASNTVTSPSLRSGVQANDPSKFLVQSSRFDLASGSVADEYQRVISILPTSGGPGTWASVNGFTYRYWSDPLFLRPLSSYTASQTTPLFMPGCTQFIVEYAGDYLKQDPTTGQILDVQSYISSGTPTAVGGVYTGTTDGQTDFIVDPVTKAHSIRWYGYPRDTNGDNVINIQPADPNLITDVVPLRDIIQKFAPGAICAPMERALPTSPAAGDYMKVTPTLYRLVWGPPGSYGYVGANPVPPPRAPSMMRITMTVDDPSGRIGDGITYEYVFKLP